jgi:PTS system cellobiose-specific IIC component
MEEHFVPVAGKIGGQRHLVAIRDGFATITPIIMAGAFAVLFNNLGFEWYQNLLNSLLPVGWKSWGGNIWSGSFAIMSILIVFTVSYHLARSYNKDGLAAGVVGVAASMILYATTPDGALPYSFLGAQGLFIALIVALVSTELFVKLIGNPRLVIKMPNGVPPAVTKSFAALIPSIIILAIAAGVKQLFITISITDMHQALFFTIQKPLQGLVGSVDNNLCISSTMVLWITWFKYTCTNYKCIITSTTFSKYRSN